MPYIRLPLNKKQHYAQYRGEITMILVHYTRQLSENIAGIVPYNLKIVQLLNKLPVFFILNVFLVTAGIHSRILLEHRGKVRCI